MNVPNRFPNEQPCRSVTRESGENKITEAGYCQMIFSLNLRQVCHLDELGPTLSVAMIGGKA